MEDVISEQLQKVAISRFCPRPVTVLLRIQIDLPVKQ
jgi:hypothetical protein